MRYRIGETPAADPFAASDGWLLFTVVLSLVIGAFLVWLGRRGRQMWLVVWSGGLVLASVGWLGWHAFGVE